MDKRGSPDDTNGAFARRASAPVGGLVPFRRSALASVALCLSDVTQKELKQSI
jgi:hypothetical protein